MSNRFKTGYVALIGKPNTGKSTLMNALIGEKVSITAHRPQTTRHAILGIKTTESYQCIFVDTPGIHDNNQKAIHRYMNRAATSMLSDVDLICVLLEVKKFNKDDEKILKRVDSFDNVLIVLNKIDQISKQDCLPIIRRIS
jgi:GTP-binding protein Era